MILLMSNNAISLSEVFVDLINIVFQICVMIWSANIMATYIGKSLCQTRLWLDLLKDRYCAVKLNNGVNILQILPDLAK